MLLRQSFRAFVLVLALGVCLPAGAEAPKRDCYGDPLPEGAVARLGNLRLRNEELIHSAAFTADGKTLAAAGDRFICFWDPITGKLIRRVQLKSPIRPNHERRRLSGDGKTLIRTDDPYTNVLRVMDASSGAEQRTLKHAHGGFIQDVDVSRDGRILAVFHRGSFVLWDVPSSTLLHEFKSPPITQYAPRSVIALTPDGKRLVLPHADGSLHLVDVASGKELCALEMPPPQPGRIRSPRIRRLAISPDSRYLAFSGDSTPLTVCELAAGKRLHELAPPGASVYLGLAFTPNGRSLAAEEHGGIRLFDVPSGKEIRKLPATAGGGNLFFSPDGRILAAVGGYNIKLWDMAREQSLHPLVGHKGMIHSLAFYPDGKRLVSAAYDNEMRVWDIASGQTLAQRANQTFPASLAVDRDGASLRFAAWDTSVHHWDPRSSGEEVQQKVVAGLSSLSANMLALSPDGRSLAVLTINRGGAQPKQQVVPQLRLYDPKTGKYRELPGLPPPDGVAQMRFAPDSRRLAVRSYRGIVQLWDRDTGKLVRELASEKSILATPFLRLSFAADGRSLLTWINRVVSICDLISGGDRLRIPVAPESLHAAAYAPDARFVACGQYDGRILLYSAVGGKQLAQWQGAQGPIQSLAFSRDSRLLASGGANGTILIWKVPEDDSVPIVRTAAEAASFWQALGASEAAAANRALAGLAAAPAQALSLFKERLPSIGKTLERSQLVRWIAELDDASFKVRDRATRELALAGEDAADVLRQALENNPSTESKRRIEDLLSRLKKGGYSQRLRALRVIEVLERIGSPQAKELLRDLEGKPMTNELRQEVQASLRRLADKP